MALLGLFLNGYIMDIRTGAMSYDNIEKSADVLNGLIKLFNDKVAKLKNSGPTGYNTLKRYQ